jgi:hypothetical protein
LEIIPKFFTIDAPSRSVRQMVVELASVHECAWLVPPFPPKDAREGMLQVESKRDWNRFSSILDEGGWFLVLHQRSANWSPTSIFGRGSNCARLVKFLSENRLSAVVSAEPDEASWTIAINKS